jgi:hypothetical protein
MYQKIIFLPLSISIICHYLFLYSDRIYNHVFLKLNNKEQHELSIIEQNIEKLQSIKTDPYHSLLDGKEYKDNILELIDKFKEEKERYLTKVSNNHTDEKNGKLNKEEGSSGVKTSIDDSKFSNFSDKVHVQQNEESQVVDNHKFIISIISKKSYKSPKKCDASYYGIGIRLSQNQSVSQVSEYSSIAKKLNIKVGDFLLGFKNSDNVFYEGNTLVPLIQKNYKNEHLTIILKQDGKITENSIILDTICYEKKLY